MGISVANTTGPGGGSGAGLNHMILWSAGISTFVATVVSGYGIYLQLKVCFVCDLITAPILTREGRTTGNRYYKGS